MSKRKGKIGNNTPHFINNKAKYHLQGKKHPPMFRNQLINQLAANLFLSVWTEDGSFDKVLDRIERDKSITPTLKLEVYKKVMASIDGFVKQFSGKNIVTKEEVEKWLNNTEQSKKA